MHRPSMPRVLVLSLVLLASCSNSSDRTITVEAGADRPWVPNQTLDLDASFEGPDGVDASYTATIDWGDGAIDTTIPQSSTRLHAQHIYATEGVFAVQVTITADRASGDGGFAVDVGDRQLIGVALDLPPWSPQDQGVYGSAFAHATHRDVPLTLALTSAPAGMTLDPNGAIEWTPAASDVGPHTIVVTATDGTVSATATADITVSAVVPQASALISASSGGVVEVTDPSSPIVHAKISIPAGALAEDTQITIAMLGTPPPTDDKTRSLGTMVEVMPTGTVFNVPARLTLPFATGAKPDRATTDDVTIRTWSQASTFPSARPGWLEFHNAVVDAASSLVSVDIAHLSPYVPAWVDALLSSTPTKAYDTPFFHIAYDDRVKQDRFYGPCVCSNPCTDQAPHYIQDLGCFVEQARNTYAADYDVGDGQSYVSVEDMQQAYTDVNYDIHVQFDAWPNVLGAMIAHEVFHIVQYRALGPNRWATNWIKSLRFAAYRWLFESSAAFEGYEVVPYVAVKNGVEPTFKMWIKPDFLLQGPISTSSGLADETVYAALPVFEYLKQRDPDFDLPKRLFGKTNPEVPLIFGTLGASYFYPRLEQLAPGKANEIWSDFAFAYQYAHASSWIPLVREALKDRPAIPAHNVLTGREREQPGADQVPPTSLLGQVIPRPTYRLDSGQIATFAVDPICDPDQAMFPCALRMLETQNPGAWSIVVRPTGHGASSGLRGTVYRMPLDSPAPADAEPEVLARFDVNDGDITIPLSKLQGHLYDQLVISFVATPGTSDTIGVDVFFTAATSELTTTGWTSCILKGDGTVRCWGQNTAGQCGNGSISDTCTTSTVIDSTGAPLSDVVHLAMDHGAQLCAIKSDSTLWCWGAGDSTMLVPGISPSAQRVTSVAGARDVATGYTELVVLADGTVASAGISRFGVLGDPAVYATSPSTPLAYPVGLTGITHVVTGNSDGDGPYACALGMSGVWCWGNNASGFLNVGPVTPTNYITGITTPSPVFGVGASSQIATSNGTTCTISGDGLLCWGRNDHGRLGIGAPEGTFGPSLVLDGSGGAFTGAVEVRVGTGHTCARKSDGSVWCWGNNQQGQLGNGSACVAPCNTQYPALVPGVTDAIQISAGVASTCALTKQGRTICWGEMFYPDGNYNQLRTPTVVN